MINKKLKMEVLGIGLIALSGAAGCSSNDSSAPVPASAGTAPTSLYNKYGGAPTVQKIVNDAVTVLIADCVENPYFTNNVINFDNVNADGDGHGTNGHDTVDRLQSCLVAQFTAALGGPSTYAGTATTSVASLSIPGQVYDCEDMTAIHGDLGIPVAVFDQFISDLGGVLAKDGVSNADINTIATGLMGFQPVIVASPGAQAYYNYQPGQPASMPSQACSVASPSPMPSSSPTPSPSPSVSPSPSPSPSTSPSPSPSGAASLRSMLR